MPGERPGNLRGDEEVKRGTGLKISGVCGFGKDGSAPSLQDLWGNGAAAEMG